MKKLVKKLLGVSACMLSLCVLEKVNAVTLAVSNDTCSAGTSREVTLELVDDEYHNIGEFQKVEFQIVVSGTAYATVDAVQPNQPSTLNFGLSNNTYSFAGTLAAGPIGKIKYTTTSELVGDFKITPTAVKFTKTDGTEMTVSNAGVKIREGSVKFEKPKSKNAALSNIIVSQGTLTPAFSSEVTDYKVQVRDTINSIRITPQAAENGKVVGGGTKTLAMGENLVEITVTSEDGSSTKTYNLNIIRGEIAEPSAYLKSLSVNNIGVELNPAFDSKNNKYTIVIDENINELNFKYETEDPLAEVTIEGNEDFQEGENTVLIKVKSSGEEPKEQTYEITVIKEAEESEEESSSALIPESKNKPSVWLIVGIIVGVLAIALGVTFVLFKKKKGDKNKKKKKDGEPPVKTKKLSIMEDDEYEDEEENSDDSVENEYINGDTDDIYQSTMSISRTSRLAKRDESVTEILKGELFEDEKTRQFDSHSFREIIDDPDPDSDGLDKTKEFNFKDFE